MKEPAHTCPDIDKIIRAIKDADDNLRYALRRLSDVRYSCDEKEQGLIDDAVGSIESAQYELDLFRSLEEIRDANSNLRDWGHHLLVELESANNYITELESKL